MRLGKASVEVVIFEWVFQKCLWCKGFEIREGIRSKDKIWNKNLITFGFFLDMIRAGWEAW